MQHPSFVILYVENPAQSASFYQQLLAIPPVEASPGFAMFVLNSGLRLGLWHRQHIVPAATLDVAIPAGGSTELVFQLADSVALQAAYAQCQQAQLPVALAPVQLDFGETFVVLDPDQHRLRFYVPGQM
jgi:catechol 2,3-dioxygenase-like lactoylglutathione lyase family enzyme